MDDVVYYVAKFNNLKFHIKGTSTVGGNKLAEHNYPFNNKRFNQYLGIKPKDYSVTAFIFSETVDSLDYEAKKRNLINEFEKQEPGILIHPFWGELNVDVDDFKIIEDDANFGKATIDVVFKEGSQQVYPTEGDVSSENIQNGADSLNDLLNNNITDTVNDTTANSTMFQRMKGKMADFGNKVDNIVQTINAVGEKLNDITSDINNFKTNLNAIISTPARLAGNVTGLINSVSSLLENPLDNFNLLQGFYNFGGDDTPTPVNTQSYINAKENDNLMNLSIQLGALAYSYSNLGNYDFNDLNELTTIQNILETQFSSIVSNSDFNEPVTDDTYSEINNKPNNINEIMDAIYNLRSNFNLYLNAQALNLPNIEIIETQENPLAVLLYDRYTSLDNYDQISALNDLENPSFINSEMEVFI